MGIIVVILRRRKTLGIIFSAKLEEKGDGKMNFDFNLEELENVNMEDFTVISSEELSEADEKAIMGASCTTCTCCCSCCSI